MATFLRKVVSGPKARHVDKELQVDLDLSYITDRLIIMGWPASSFEALYRNRRKDVRRFLDAKHGEKYRVYNLCPCSENRYDAKEFYGAVSRYPFPDHHPPPLSLIPMFVCDVTAWLAADPENVAVIHCKAGKGRSGTMTCSYLLSLPVLPGLTGENAEDKAQSDAQRSLSEGSRNASLSFEGKQAALLGNPLAEHTDLKSSAGKETNVTRRGSAAVNQSAYSIEALTERLNAVFELHTAKRLKPQKPNRTPPEPNFLTIDPSEQTAVAENGQSLRRSHSVANILRKASQGFRSVSNPMTQNIQPSWSSRRGSSASSTPVRAPVQGTANPTHVSALGVTPMGRSTSDLPGMKDRERRSASTSGLDRNLWLTPNHSPLPKSKTLAPSQDLSCLDRYAFATGTDSSIGAQDGLSPPSLRPPKFQIGGGSPMAFKQSRALSSSPYPIDSSGRSSSISVFASEVPSHANTDDEETPPERISDDLSGRRTRREPIRLAVSIPSQRRFVGYWSRMLAGRDARCSPLPSCMEAARSVRITRISIQRKDDDADSTKDGKVAFSIQLSRYDPQMESRLHQWETSARLRTRAYGFADPSAPAPTLPPEQLSEHGTDFKGPTRRRLEREADAERWKAVEEENKEGGYELKMSQHGNDCGVGCWGINVLAEQDRVRHFPWSEVDKVDGQLAEGDKRAAGKDEMMIEHLAYVYESKQSQGADGLSDRSMLRSGAEVGTGVVRHEFYVEGDLSNVRHEKTNTPTWLKDALSRKSEQRKAPTSSKVSNATSSSKSTSPNGSLMMRSDAQAKPPHSTPPTSVESLPQDGADASRGGIVVNADHALMIKILAGRSGTTHNLLPDMASCGYIWFIPSFESPARDGEVTCQKGERVRCSFSTQEIDFRKAKKVAKLLGGEILHVEVEWEWLDAASVGADGAESVEEFLM